MNLVYTQNVLFVMAQLAGFVLLLSVVFLLSKRIIYLDSKTKQPVEIELPFFGKIQTQSPVIVLVLIAAGLVIFPITQSRQDFFKVEGNVVSSGDVRVAFIPKPRFESTVSGTSSFQIWLPVITEAQYHALYIVNNQIAHDKGFVLDPNGTILPDFTYSPSSASQPPVQARKELSDDAVKRLGIY